MPTLNCREFSSPQLQNSSDEKSSKLLVNHLTVIVIRWPYGEINHVQCRHKSSSASFTAAGPDNLPSHLPINILKVY